MNALLNLLIIAASRHQPLKNIGIVFVIAAGLFYVVWRIKKDGKFVWNPVVVRDKFGGEYRLGETVLLWTFGIFVILFFLGLILVLADNYKPPAIPVRIVD